MIDIKTFLDAASYKITDVFPYQWKCFGEDVVALEVDGQYNSLYSAGMVFSLRDQVVFQAYVHDYQRNRAYRLCNPQYHEAYTTEVGERQCDDTAWDEVRYCDLELEEDFLEKLTAIMNGQEYSTDVKIPLDLDDKLLFDLMLQAHKKDITLNELITSIISKFTEQNISTVAQR